MAKGSFVLKEPFIIILMGSWEGKETLRLPVCCLEPDSQGLQNQKDVGLQTETMVSFLTSPTLRFLI